MGTPITVDLAIGATSSVLTASTTPTVVPSCMKLTHGEAGYFELEVDTCGTGWNKGFIAFRNYAVPNGTTLVTPSITRRTDGKVLRHSEVITNGPAEIGFFKNRWIDKAISLLLINAVVFAFVVICLQLSLVSGTQVVSAGLLCGSAFYQLMFAAGKKGLDTFVNGCCKTDNKWHLASLGEGWETSQPSTLHMYCAMRFDLTKLDDANSFLSIEGTIFRDRQKYFSLVLYDIYGLPLKQYIHSGNVTELARTDSSHSDTSDSDASVATPAGSSFAAAFDYNIRLVRNPEPKDYVTGKHDVIDVSRNPIGYALFRIVHPTVPNSIIEECSSPVCRIRNVKSQ